MPHLQRLLNLARIFNQRQVSSLRVRDSKSLTIVLLFAGEVTTPTGSSSEISSEDEETAPLPLEVDIPKERLPDILLVNLPGVSFWHDAPAAAVHSMRKFMACNPVKYVRKYPVRIPTTLFKGKLYLSLHHSVKPSLYTDTTTCDMSKDSYTLERRLIGHLDLGRKEKLGDGSHSHVYLAPLSLQTCAGQSLRCDIAVKIARYRYEKAMFVKEARIYDKFPCELQESTPLSTPVVPRFYGYYEPSCESADSYKGDDGDEEDASTVRQHVREFLGSTISPMLLLEPCGEQIDVGMLSQSNK